MASKKEQMEIRFIRLQRTFVLWALRFYAKFDNLLGVNNSVLGPSQVFGATTDAEIDACLAWLNRQHNRALVRVAFWVHSRLDTLSKLKARILTSVLWVRMFYWKVFPDTRLGGYSRWVQMYDTGASHQNSQKQPYGEAVRPKIAIVLWNPKRSALKSLLQSVDVQSFPCDELIVVGPRVTFSKISKSSFNSSYEGDLIHVQHESTNDTIEMINSSDCDYFVFINGAGVIAQEAVERLADYANKHPEAHIIYGDEDDLNWRGKRIRPRFHPDWDLDYGLAQNVFGNLAIIKKQALGELSDRCPSIWDFFLSLIPNADRVGHIPHVLFHSFKSPKTVPESDWLDAVKAYMCKHYPRNKVVKGLKGKLRIVWPLPNEKPKVTLLIPTKDRVDLLENLIDGLLNRTSYSIHEIIVIDNRSELEETKSYLKKIQDVPCIRVIRYDHPFNYSAINNFAFEHASGDVIGLLNNDLEVMSAGWLEEMVRQALRPEVGIVGAKLYYKNNFIQHAGVVLGVGPVAGHMHPLEHRSAKGYCDRLLFAHSYSAVTGACMVMRREVFEKLEGLNDKDLAVAYNDIDICLRARELGYKIIWTPYAELYHLESASRPVDTLPMQVRRYRNEIHYMRERWGKYFAYDETYNLNLSNESHHFALAFPPRFVSRMRTDGHQM